MTIKESEKTYKYEISEDIFIDAFTATNEEFQENSIFFHKYGIERKKGELIQEKHSFNLYSEDYYTIFKNSSISEIELYNFNSKIEANLLFLDCKLSTVRISQSSFGVNQNSETSPPPSIYLFKVNFEDLYIDKDTHLGNIIIKNSDQVSSLNGKIHQIILNDAKTGYIYVLWSTVSFLITDSEVPEITVRSSKIGLFKLGIGCLTRVFLAKCRIKCLDLKNTAISDNSSLSLSDTSLETCLIEEVDVLGRLNFRKIRPMIIEYSFPYHYSKFLKSYKNEVIESAIEKFRKKFKIGKSTFRISYASLGNTEFIDCDLNAFEQFEFNNSRLTEVFISGGSMPGDNVEIHGMDEKNIEWNIQQISLLNQFASVFARQGNIFRSYNYKARAAIQQKELYGKKFRGGDSKRVPFKEKLENMGHYIPLFINHWSNYHGASWVRALLFVLLSSFFLYCAILTSTGNLWFGLKYEPKFVGFYFDFLNPFRPFDLYTKTMEIKINSWTRFLDLFSRIVIGYGIYQLIQAFRRYGRK